MSIRHCRVRHLGLPRAIPRSLQVTLDLSTSMRKNSGLKPSALTLDSQNCCCIVVLFLFLLGTEANPGHKFLRTQDVCFQHEMFDSLLSAAFLPPLLLPHGELTHYSLGARNQGAHSPVLHEANEES